MADTFPEGSLLFWPGTHAAVAGIAGYTRRTTYDGLYLMGSDADFDPEADRTGGSSDPHTHDVVGTHTHSSPVHTHEIATSSPGGTAALLRDSGTNISLPSTNHTHNVATTSSATSITVGASTASGWDTAEPGGPTRVELIVLTPNDGNQKLPQDAVIMADATEGMPGDCYLADGDNGTDAVFDANPRFIQVPATEADAGALIASTIVHTHEESSPHTHTTDVHQHDTPVACGYQTLSGLIFKSGASTALSWLHHNVHLTNATSNPATGAETLETSTGWMFPPVIRMYPYQNTGAGQADLWEGIVCGYEGPLESLPNDWQLCDGSGNSYDMTNQQVMLDDALLGLQQGSLTHSHDEGAGHTHSLAAHTHPTSVAFLNPGIGTNFGFGRIAIGRYAAAHTHSVWTVSSESPTITDDDTWVTGETNSLLPYRTLVWIRYNGVQSLPSVNLVGLSNLIGDLNLTGVV